MVTELIQGMHITGHNMGCIDNTIIRRDRGGWGQAESMIIVIIFYCVAFSIWYQAYMHNVYEISLPIVDDISSI